MGTEGTVGPVVQISASYAPAKANSDRNINKTVDAPSHPFVQFTIYNSQFTASTLFDCSASGAHVRPHKRGIISSSSSYLLAAIFRYKTNTV